MSGRMSTHCFILFYLGGFILKITDKIEALSENILSENIRVAKKYGSAMTVRPVIESVVITDSEEAEFENFKNRNNTYSLTSPQSFKLGILLRSYQEIEGKNTPIPLLDSALVFTYLGNKIHIIQENNNNIKVTTPEDYYILKAMLELEENRYVFGIN